MDIPRKLGILVFTAVPAIIGGGIVYHIFGTLSSILVYEIILYLLAGSYMSK